MLGATHMLGKAINEIIARAASLPVRLTGHSGRSGLGTEARRARHDAKTIATQGGWRPNSAELYHYMQIVDAWSDNPSPASGCNEVRLDGAKDGDGDRRTQSEKMPCETYPGAWSR